MRPLVRAGALLSLLTVGAGSLLIGSRSPAASESRPEVVISDVELGRLLFWDPVLSGEMDVACATCHHPDFAYADGRALALGPRSVGLGPARVDLSGAEIPVVQRNTPTVLNIAFNSIERRRRRGGGRDGEFAPLPASVDDEIAARAPMFWIASCEASSRRRSCP